MKMIMPLVATEDGIVQFVKQPGVSLEPGDILGILSLDDPARVKHAKPFEGQLPPMGLPSMSVSKPHQRLTYCLDILNNILDGYDNQAIMSSTLKDLVSVLQDQDLPYSQMSSVLAALSGRMPSKLEDSIRSVLTSSKQKHQDFPAPRIRKYIESYINDNVRAQDRSLFRTSLAPLIEVVERFKQGLKHHEWDVFADLLRRYESTEKLFGGSIEARVLALREQHRTELDKVAGLVLSHMKAQSKGRLALPILEMVKERGANFASIEGALSQVLHDLAGLESRFVLFFRGATKELIFAKIFHCGIVESS
jgi:acetyl-CoA carboxylase/biotin carboxylase 1